MLPKSRRLSRPEFLTAKKLGQSRRFSHFTLIIYSRPSPAPLSKSRFSIVTSAKLHKHAVVRNRLRRQIYNQLRLISHSPNADIIILPKPSMLNLSRDQISLALNQALSKLAGD